MASSMKVLLSAAACSGIAAVILRQQKTTLSKQDEWALQCEEDLHGLVTPYYVPGIDGTTKVGCVPQVCENKLGRSDDVAVETAPKCTWDKMEETCCTNLIKTPCESGQLPCILGEVSTLGDYTSKAVMQSNSTDAESVKADCGTVASDFDTSSGEAVSAAGGK
ncbi:unnamed protein product [Amoebophrya sp. A25]|nr:unnamed protein product [Amoebophrya sp. A25]|eukprot:GSA25T00027051001.1